MKTYTPLNSINTNLGEELANKKMYSYKADNTRLKKYNAELKLQIIELRQKLILIEKILKKKI
jgi:hypothetical protein|tara:strand:- start:1566 stop:1754 length:189 start_codon:yes stop_codon:yes gene_type:complete